MRYGYGMVSEDCMRNCDGMGSEDGMYSDNGLGSEKNKGSGDGGAVNDKKSISSANFHLFISISYIL